MNKRFLLAPFLALTLAVGAQPTAYADDVIEASSLPTISPLLELYTSEGCSSCPPADEWLGKVGAALSRDFHAIPLVFHVDYWDRLGWKDPFASQAYTKRQQDIASINRQRTLYTPQFVVSGEEARGGKHVLGKIQSSNLSPATLSLSMRLEKTNDHEVATEISIENQSQKVHAEIWLAVYENNLVREIGDGENEGKTLHHNYVVRHWQKVQTIDLSENQHKNELVLSLDNNWAKENLGVAVLVLQEENGETLQGLRAPLTSLFET